MEPLIYEVDNYIFEINISKSPNVEIVQKDTKCWGKNKIYYGVICVDKDDWYVDDINDYIAQTLDAYKTHAAVLKIHDTNTLHLTIDFKVPYTAKLVKYTESFHTAGVEVNH